MRILVVEDDMVSRKYLEYVLEEYGTCDVAVNGRLGADAFADALDRDTPYDLVCLDIMMPEMDGQAALRSMRRSEWEHDVPSDSRAAIIMTSALDDPQNIAEAYYGGGATAYLAKPIDRSILLRLLRTLGLIA